MTAAHDPFITWLPLAEQRIVPWRNGGGSTREVAIEPTGAAVAAGFRWRVSTAAVASDGPFSRFPGVDRRLWLLAGRGMDLTIDGRVVRLDRPLQHVDFPGEAAVAARLLGCACEDLNVMHDRAAVQASGRLLQVAAATAWSRRLNDAQHVLYAVEGDLAMTSLGRGLARHDAVRIDGACDLVLSAGPVSAVVLLASFRPASPVTLPSI